MKLYAEDVLPDEVEDNSDYIECPKCQLDFCEDELLRFHVSYFEYLICEDCVNTFNREQQSRMDEAASDYEDEWLEDVRA